MAIRVIQRGTVKCDKCQKLVCVIKCSKELMSMLDEERRFCDVFCVNCVDLKDYELETNE